MWDTQRALSAVFIRGVSRERETEKGKDNISCRICPCLVWARWKGVSPETLTRVSSGCQTGRMGYDDITWLSSVFVSPAFFYQFAFRARLTRMKIFWQPQVRHSGGTPPTAPPQNIPVSPPLCFTLCLLRWVEMGSSAESIGSRVCLLPHWFPRCQLSLSGSLVLCLWWMDDERAE